MVALLPVGYLIPRSVFHMTALEPLKARVDQDLWANLERLEGEKKDEVKSMRKEIAERRQAARLTEKGAEASMQSCSSLVLSWDPRLKCLVANRPANRLTLEGRDT